MQESIESERLPEVAGGCEKSEDCAKLATFSCANQRGLVCLTLYEVADKLNADPVFLAAFEKNRRGAGGISYPALVKWVKSGVFPNAHRVASRWVVPLSDLDGIEERIPALGNPDWREGKPRRDKKTYRWGYYHRDQAQQIFDAVPMYGSETPRNYALRAIREKVATLPEHYQNGAGYPRKELTRELTRIAEANLAPVE